MTLTLLIPIDSGALSWQWTNCEAQQCKVLVYADSLSPVSSDSYRFSQHSSAALSSDNRNC